MEAEPFGPLGLCYVPGSNFCHLKRLIETVLGISKNLRSKGQGHHMAKYGQKGFCGSITPFYSPGMNICQ